MIANKERNSVNRIDNIENMAGCLDSFPYNKNKGKAPSIYRGMLCNLPLKRGINNMKVAKSAYGLGMKNQARITLIRNTTVNPTSMYRVASGLASNGFATVLNS